MEPEAGTAESPQYLAETQAARSALAPPPVTAPAAEAPPAPAAPQPAATPTAVSEPPNAMEQALKIRQKQIDDAEAVSKRVGEQRDRALQIAFQPTARPQLPQFKSIPEADKMRMRSGFEAFKSPAIFLALMGSLASRRPMIGAMQAATGAIEGFQEGDKIKVERSRQIWKDKTEQAVKQNEIELNKYNAVLSNAKLGQADRIAQINAIAAANKDEVTLASLRSGAYGDLGKLYEDRVKALEDLKKSVYTATAKRGEDVELSGAKRKTPEELGKEVDLELSSQGKKPSDPDYSDLRRRSLELRVQEQESKAKTREGKPDLGFYKGTEAQLKGVFFASMMERGNRNLDKLKSEGYQPGWRELSTMDKIWSTSKEYPAVANQLFATLSEPAQRYYQASAEFVSGVLRKETGAAFNAGELINELQRYITGPWDAPGMTKQKEEARRGVEEATWASTGLPTGAWNLESAKKLLGGNKAAETALGTPSEGTGRPEGAPPSAVKDKLGRWVFPDPSAPGGWSEWREKK